MTIKTKKDQSLGTEKKRSWRRRSDMNVLLGLFSRGDIYISEIDKKIAVLGQDHAWVMLRRLSSARKLTKLMLRGAARRVQDTVTASARRTAPGSHRHYPNKSVSAAWLGWKSLGSVIDVPAVSANNTVILAILPSGEVIIWDIYLLHTVLARLTVEIYCCDDLYL